MGFGFMGYDNCCDFAEGYGDGPCGGYYSYWEKCRRDAKRDRNCGCCDGRDCGHCDGRDCGCCDNRGCGCCDNRGCGCCDGRDYGCCGGRDCGRCDGRDCGCCKPGFSDCSCFPFGCGSNWRNPRCGLFLSIPCGCCSMGFFMPFLNRRGPC